MLSSLNVQNVNAESLQANNGSVVNLTATTLNNMNVSDLFNKRNIPSYADVDAARAALSEGDIYSLDGEDTLRVLREIEFYGQEDTFDTLDASWTIDYNANNVTPDPTRTHALNIGGGKLIVSKTGNNQYNQIAYRDFDPLEVGQAVSINISHTTAGNDFNGLVIFVKSAIFPFLRNSLRFYHRKDTGAWYLQYWNNGGTNVLNLAETGQAALVQNATTMSIRRVDTAQYEFYFDETLVSSYTIPGTPPEYPADTGLWLNIASGLRTWTVDDYKIYNF